MKEYHFKRFLDAQNQTYLTALAEIKKGRKETHWMWFIFPQLEGLGQSETSKFYALADLQEAAEFLAHPVLGKHLVQISEALLNTPKVSAKEVLGHPDDLKLRSSMTLFAQTEKAHPVFTAVLERYFDGKEDERTLKLLSRKKPGHDTI